MSIDALKGMPEKELRAKLTQLSTENFNTRFTTERMTSVKGAGARSRKREIARILTVLAGREKLKQQQDAEKALATALEKTGPAHSGTVEDKRRRRKLRDRLAQTRRSVRGVKLYAEGK
ncbi:MAG: 50S ribosomal protein L29 [Planctomycetes bacterium]|nr:50S ribosomal protein L29 [Planctomycetota bacterium]